MSCSGRPAAVGPSPVQLVRTCGARGVSDPVAIARPDRHVETPWKRQPRQHPSRERIQPDVPVAAEGIESDLPSVGREAQRRKRARRNRKSLRSSCPVDPYHRSFGRRKDATRQVDQRTGRRSGKLCDTRIAPSRSRAYAACMTSATTPTGPPLTSRRCRSNACGKQDAFPRVDEVAARDVPGIGAPIDERLHVRRVRRE